MDVLDLAMTIARRPFFFASIALWCAALLAAPAARAESGLYRVTLLAQTGGYLIVSGGDALRIFSGCRCESVPPGTSILVELDADGRVVALRRSTGAEEASEKLPPAAIVVDARSSRTLKNNEAAVHSVTVTLFVQVPSDTPQTDDLYVSTSRSGWGAAELRMERVDAVHWQISIRVPDGTPLLYRYSRGSFATLEADRAGQLAPPRKIVAREGLVQRDAVLRFADTQ